LENLHAGVWHADTLSAAPVQVQPTGSSVLDAQLPGGGWPVGAMTEILQPEALHSEWRLLLPALSGAGTGPVVLVGSPLVPFAPALQAQGLAMSRLLRVAAQTHAERLWSAEQALRCAEVSAVLLWLPPTRASASVRPDQLRRLQMAATEHHKLLFVMRADQALHDASPAVLRLRVVPLEAGDAASTLNPDALEVRVLKRRGPPLTHLLHLAARPPRMAVMLAASNPRPGHALVRAPACA
jgi:protein ImuA